MMKPTPVEHLSDGKEVIQMVMLLVLMVSGMPMADKGQ